MADESDRSSGKLAFAPFDADADFDDVLALMQDTWYDPGSSGLTPEASRLLAAAELTSYLSRHTFSCLAWLEPEGAPRSLVGITLARHGQPTSAVRERWERPEREAAEKVVSLLGDDAGNTWVSAEGTDVRRGDEKPCLEETWAKRVILRRCGMADDDCVQLLVVSPEARGLGLGRRLLDRARRYLHEQGATRYHLVTDTECDWGFYEHLGLRRLGEQATLSPEGLTPDVYFVYGDSL